MWQMVKFPNYSNTSVGQPNSSVNGFVSNVSLPAVCICDIIVGNCCHCSEVDIVAAMQQRCINWHDQITNNAA